MSYYKGSIWYSMRTERDTRLGELEATVMGLLWERDEASVRDIQRALRPQRELAYTTVLTVLSRLHDKGLVERRKDGRAHVYSAASPQAEVSAPILESVVRTLFGGSRSRAIAQLLRGDEEIPDQELRRLEELIRERREGRRDS